MLRLAFLTEKFILALFNKMDSRREVKFKSSATRRYYSFRKEIFSFREFFRSKHFQKLWPLLLKRAKLDLRSTNIVFAYLLYGNNTEPFCVCPFFWKFSQLDQTLFRDCNSIVSQHVDDVGEGLKHCVGRVLTFLHHLEAMLSSYYNVKEHIKSLYLNG